jgi:hypothetical protein
MTSVCCFVLQRPEVIVAKYRRARRDKVITFRVTAVEYEILERIAEMNDWTIADVLRASLDRWLKNYNRRMKDRK